MQTKAPREDLKEFELYDGRFKGRLYEGSHRYYGSWDGGPFTPMSGVTTYCGIKDKSRPLGMWQQGMTLDFLMRLLADRVKIDHDKAVEAVIQHELYLEQSADIGKEIHAYIEAYINRKLKLTKEMPEMPNFPEATTGVSAFLDWEKAHKVKWIGTETQVASREYGYVGTLDLEAEIDGEHGISDFKSSNGLYNSVRAQTAAYTMAVIEERKATKQKVGKDEFKSRWAIRFSKYTEAEYMKREQRKQVIRQAIARYKGKAAKSYPIKPYQVFEAVPLDTEKGNLQRDFDAFLHMVELTKWDRLTDPYTNGGL